MTSLSRAGEEKKEAEGDDEGKKKGKIAITLGIGSLMVIAIIFLGIIGMGSYYYLFFNKEERGVKVAGKLIDRIPITTSSTTTSFTTTSTTTSTTLTLITTCSQDSECGTSGYVGNYYCKDNNVVRKFSTYKCIYPGTRNSYCSNSTQIKVEDICEKNEEECEEGKSECQQKATCYDGIKNQNEEGVDCGGPCEDCETAKKRKSNKCTCGCGLTLDTCIEEHPTCTVSRRLLGLL